MRPPRWIVADDQVGTATFRLRRVDPDFLFKPATTYAEVHPATTPSREASHPLPGDRPYMLAATAPPPSPRSRNPASRGRFEPTRASILHISQGSIEKFDQTPRVLTGGVQVGPEVRDADPEQPP